MNASEIARHAAELVSGDRAKTHGDKARVHANIAQLWTAYLRSRPEGEAALGPADVALMMVLLKVGRTLEGAHNPDDYVDAVGYAAIAGELAERAAPESKSTEARFREVTAERQRAASWFPHKSCDGPCDPDCPWPDGPCGRENLP